MKYVKRILAVLILVFGVSFIGVYAFWSFIFFPDDYECTRAEALIHSETSGSQVMTHMLAPMIDHAILKGNYSQNYVKGIVRQLKKKSYQISVPKNAILYTVSVPGRPVYGWMNGHQFCSLRKTLSPTM